MNNKTILLTQLISILSLCGAFQNLHAQNNQQIYEDLNGGLTLAIRF